jgi:transposase
LARLHAELRALVRTAAGRKPQPTAAVIDSQPVRAADTVPRASRGWDNAKKVNGRKRHIAVDVMGLVLDVVITAAPVQDRQGARPLLDTHRARRYVRLVWADAGYTASPPNDQTLSETRQRRWGVPAGRRRSSPPARIPPCWVAAVCPGWRQRDTR